MHEGQKPKELDLLPLAPPECAPYLRMFSLLRSRYSKTEIIPISEMVALIQAFEHDMKTSLNILLACDNAWRSMQ